MNRSGPRPVLDHEIDFGVDVGHVQTGIGHANSIWRPDFQFNMRTIRKARSNPPGDTGVIGDQEKCVRQIGRIGGTGWVAGTSVIADGYPLHGPNPSRTNQL